MENYFKNILSLADFEEVKNIGKKIETQRKGRSKAEKIEIISQQTKNIDLILDVLKLRTLNRINNSLGLDPKRKIIELKEQIRNHFEITLQKKIKISKISKHNSKNNELPKTNLNKTNFKEKTIKTVKPLENINEPAFIKNTQNGIDDISSQMKELSRNIKEHKDSIKNEEQTKHTCIIPFIKVLGYNPYNPKEVRPEFLADRGTKKGKKVDYAILKNDEPIILIECKSMGVQLNDQHANQLFDYFSHTNAKIGILTNGILFRFFADLNKENLMDREPFMVMNLSDLDTTLISILKKMTKENFNINDIKSIAKDLIYIDKIKSYISVQFYSPDDSFLKYITSKIHEGKITKKISNQFNNIIRKALMELRRDGLMKYTNTTNNQQILL